MTGRWIPGDDELDAIARALDMDAPGPDRADRTEHNRTAILAAAATRTQQARRSAAPFVVAGIAIAAAAAVVLVIGARTTAPTTAPIAQLPRQVVTPLGAARFERVTDWPDYVVRVDDGTIAVQVDRLAAAERFRVKTADAEVEVRGTRFDVGVETGRLTSVAVHEGRVEVRTTDQQVVILSAGERWTPTQTAQRDAVEVGVSQRAAWIVVAPAGTAAIGITKPRDERASTWFTIVPEASGWARLTARRARAWRPWPPGHRRPRAGARAAGGPAWCPGWRTS